MLGAYMGRWARVKFAIPMVLDDRGISLHFKLRLLDDRVQATVGVILSSLLLLPWADLSSVNWIGVISGVLFAASTRAAFIAVSQLGVGVATALWGGTAVLASMIWDIRVDHHTEASNPDVAAGAVLVMVIGLAAVAVNGRYNEFLNQQRQEGAPLHGPTSAALAPCASVVTWRVQDYAFVVAAELAVDSEDEELVLELVQERRLSEDRVMGESSIKGHYRL